MPRPELSPQQREAAGLLAAGLVQREVAERLGVNRLTITRWLRREDFTEAVSRQREELHAAREAAVAQECADAMSGLRQLVAPALAVLREVLQDRDASARDRLRAAEVVLRRIVPELSAVQVSASVEVTDAERARLREAAAQLTDADLGLVAEA